MQITHVGGNLRQSLRRNVSMHLAVVLTLFVSLTLGGIGVMLSKEADLIVQKLQDDLKLTIFFCIDDDPQNEQGCTGDVTDQQRAAVEDVVKNDEDVKDYYFMSQQEAYDEAKEVLGPQGFEGPNPAVTVEDFQQSMWITLQDPDDYQGLQSEVESLDGVSYVRPAQELVGPIFTVINVLKWGAWGGAAVLLGAAILLVANTIRLAALARRREIEIMRLVGASTFFVALPFLLEALVIAAIGVTLSGGALALFTQFAIVGGLDDYVKALPFVGWPDYWETVVVIAIAGPALTVLPTLLLTRKYIRV